MPRIPREIVDAIRDRTDIAAVIGRRVKLQKRGNSLVGLCPFHQEKSPSFHVIPAKHMFHCFGCQEGGDVFGFLMRLEGLSFVEAVKELAGPAGVSIREEELSPEQRHALRTRATLFEVLEAAASFFESRLWTHPDGQGCRDYLGQRRLDPEIARAARLGYAPGGWRELIDHLHRHGFPLERAVEAGLARPRRSGEGHYDFFRDRLMFPILDDRSRVIGFGGRVLQGDGPKYLNTGQTSLYDKSSALYGIDGARAAIQRADRVVIVEGYFDVLAMRAAGHAEAVATCGTALTRQHVERLARLSRNVLLLTDADSAGQEAASRALPLLMDAGVHGFRVDLPSGKDPDELVAAEGPEALSAALERRQSLLEWVVDRKLRQHGDPTSAGVDVTAMARERVLDELQGVLARVPHSLVSRVASRLGMREELVLERLKQAPTQRTEADAAPSATQGWRPHRDVVHLLWLLVHRYDQVADLIQAVDPDVLRDHPATHTAIARLLTGEPVAAVVAEEADAGVARTLRAVVARDQLYEADVAAQAACEVLRRLVAPHQIAEKASLTSRYEQALRDGDPGAGRALLTRMASLKREIDAMDAALRRGDLPGFLATLAPPPAPVVAPTSAPSPDAG